MSVQSQNKRLKKVSLQFSNNQRDKKYVTISFSLKRGLKRKRFILSQKNSDHTSIGKKTLPKERQGKRDYFPRGF